METGDWKGREFAPSDSSTGFQHWSNNSFMTSGGFVRNKYFYPLDNSQEAEEIMEVVTSLFVGRDTTEGTW